MNKDNFKLTSQLTEIITPAILGSFFNMDTAIALQSIWLFVKSYIIGVFL